MKLSHQRVIFIVAFLLCFAGMQLFGQKTSSKATKYFEKALSYYENNDWNACEIELNKTILADSTFSDAWLMKGDIYRERGQTPEAVVFYKKALLCNPEKPDVIFNLLANTLFSDENYSGACVYYSKLLEMQDISKEMRVAAESKLRLAEVRMKLMEHPVSFDPVSLGPVVNTLADEYVNAFATDGSGVYFTRRIKNTGQEAREFVEDFYFASYSGDSILFSSFIDYPPGKKNDAGAVCISADGRLIFFTSCFRNDSYGSCDLYYAEKQGDTWSTAMNMGATVNSESWDAQPSVSPDGKTLYFASNRRGGIGGSDIWMTERGTDGSWKKPVNLGLPVNTQGSEMAPFIHFDNKSLYFSSGGHPGMGGTDLFKSVRNEKSWKEPVNLGYPLNSSSDELIIIVNPEGDKGFISSNSLEGAGGYDIYRFALTEALRPVPVSYLKGKVFDLATHLPLKAEFELIDIKNDIVVISSFSDAVNGEFLVCLPCDRNYALNVSCPGYLFYSEHFPFSGQSTAIDPLIKDIPLEPIREGNRTVLRNVFFQTDKYQLEPESFPELDKLFDFLKDNPGIRVEIGGHTDDQGTTEYNLELSRKRAQSVYEYLLNKGSNGSKITFKGFGETQPVSSNETEEGRALNRRTEITIL